MCCCVLCGVSIIDMWCCVRVGVAGDFSVCVLMTWLAQVLRGAVMMCDVVVCC